MKLYAPVYAEAIMLLCLAASLPITHSQTTPPSYKPMAPYGEIESKARRAEANDRQSIHDLAHEILITRHVYSIPESVAGVLENRLTDAEIKFRNKTGPGVSEEQMVDLMNWMGEKLRLPTYTATTPAQVRTLRMKLAVSSPVLMGNTLSGKDLKPGDHVRTELSPLQAMHLLYVMADQKILNEDYQNPSVDILAAERERGQKAGTSKTHLRVSTNHKSVEVMNALSSSVYSISVQDALDIINRTLRTLHLD
jgi:hypothetical protein